MNFGTRLRALRERAGYGSPEAFADAIGVSKQTVYNWEKRLTPPPSSRLEIIARGLGISVAELLRSESTFSGQVQEPGGQTWRVQSEDPAIYGARPATRQTVEAYFRERCAEAEDLKNANVFPWMLGKLMEHFPPGFARHFPAQRDGGHET